MTAWKLVFVATSFLLIACYRSGNYTGSGVMVDHGSRAATNRYVVTLGEIQLNREAKYEFHAAGLPHVEMTVGLAVALNTSTLEVTREKLLTTFVMMELTDSAGREVIREKAPLNKWVWTRRGDAKKCFIYRKGDEKEIVKGASTHYKQIGLKADAGWGTYFTPKRGGSYKLSVIISPGNLSENLTAWVVIKGGGWK